MDRLQLALDLYLRLAEDGDVAQEQQLLAEHPDLRDLLEPMLVRDVGERTPPRALRDFRLIREIGRGGMGVVHEAEQISLRRRVALKVLPPFDADNPTAIARLRREAAAAASLKHRNIVQVHAVGTEGDVHYFAMELVEGASLATVLRHLRAAGAPPTTGAQVRAAIAACLPVGARAVDVTRDPAHDTAIATMVEIVAQLADALAHAHRAGIVHRDVKPGNVLLRPDGTPVLTDFGLARTLRQPSMSRSGDVAGTPFYMAPEQIFGRRDVDGRADVFSLGATLYELLTLVRPFAGETSASVLHQIVHREPEPIRRHNPGLPIDIVAIVGKALEKDPARRYPTAEAFAADLRAFLAYRPVSVRMPTPRERVLRYARREPLKATFAVVVLLAVPTIAVLAGYLIAQAPQVAAGERFERAQRLEHVLAEAFAELGEGARDAARAGFVSALELDAGSPEAVAGLAVAALAEGGARAALQVLDAHAASVDACAPLQRLRRSFAARDDASAVATETAAPPVDALDHFLIGVVAMVDGHAGDAAKFADAARSLERAVVTSRHARPVFHFEWLHAVAHVGDAGDIERASAAVLALWPESAFAWFWAGFAALGADSARAVERFRRATQLEPRHALAHENLGLALRQIGDYAAAKAAYREALRLAPRAAPAWCGLARACLEDDDLDGARVAIDRAIGAGGRTEVTLGLLATVQWRSGEHDAAFATAHEGTTRFPNCAPLWVVRGRAELQAERAADGLASIDRAHANGADDTEAWFLLGLARFRAKDRDGARAAYATAIERDPRNAEAHCNLGILQRDAKDVAAATASFQRAIDAKPTLRIAYENLLTMAVRRNDRATFAELVARWRAADPASPRAQIQEAYLDYWLDGRKRGARTAAALTKASDAIEREGGKDVAMLHFLGMLHEVDGDRAAALAAFERALAVAEAGPADANLRQVRVDVDRVRRLLADKDGGNPR